jgi:hypothetical protein
MSSSGASVAYLILATFFGGFWLGVIAMVAVAVRKEDRRFSLSGAAPGAAARGGESSHPLRRRRHSLPAA